EFVGVSQIRNHSTLKAPTNGEANTNSKTPIRDAGSFPDRRMRRIRIKFSCGNAERFLTGVEQTFGFAGGVCD
ncbi:MAG: hypothetical protein ABW171_04815, partial [Steroidobacter sp.]